MISWRLYYIKLLILNDIFYLHTWHHHQNIHYDKCNKTILLYWCSGRRHDSCVFQTCTRWYLWKKTYFEGHTCGNEIWNLRVQTERGATLEKVYNFPKRFSESYSYFKLLTNICVFFCPMGNIHNYLCKWFRLQNISCDKCKGMTL